MLTLKEILTFQAENTISDLHLITGEVPCMRQKNGKITALNDTPLSKEDVDLLLKELLNEDEFKEMKHNLGYDFAKEFFGLGRFRINIYYEVKGIGLNIRYIDESLIDYKKMEIPAPVLDIVNNRNGLLLITGPNNSGKSTLMNSIVDYLNETRELKIVMFEDPIEHVHHRKKSLISQRIMDTNLEANAKQLKYVFRQDTNIVCVGEIRDYQTMHTVMTMCEAGYFVIATLHTTGAVQGIERIVNLYPANKRSQIFGQIGVQLRSIVSQTLVQYKDENQLIPCREIFIPDDAVRKLIKSGDISSIYNHMQITGKKGNILFDQYLIGLFRQGSITEETLMKNYHDKDILMALLK